MSEPSKKRKRPQSLHANLLEPSQLTTLAECERIIDEICENDSKAGESLSLVQEILSELRKSQENALEKKVLHRKATSFSTFKEACRAVGVCYKINQEHDWVLREADTGDAELSTSIGKIT